MMWPFINREYIRRERDIEIAEIVLSVVGETTT